MGQKSENSSFADLDTKTEQVLRRKHYKLQNKLGAGAYGTVYKAEISGNNGSGDSGGSNSSRFAAVKVLDLTKMSDNYKNKFLPRELQTLIETKHENIIEVYDIIRANHRLYIFMEFAENGDISGYVRKHNGAKLQLAAIWFYQITQGLIHLHEQCNTAHRDIKLDNFLLGPRYVAKLSDFGFARVSYDKGYVILSHTYCGTLPYEAPKVIKRQHYDPFKADVWSMGVSWYVLLYNRFPYHYKTNGKRDEKGMVTEMYDYPRYIRSRCTGVSGIPTPAKELIEMMLNPDEDRRVSINTVAHNEWLTHIAQNGTVSQHMG